MRTHKNLGQSLVNARTTLVCARVCARLGLPPAIVKLSARDSLVNARRRLQTLVPPQCLLPPQDPARAPLLLPPARFPAPLTYAAGAGYADRWGPGVRGAARLAAAAGARKDLLAA